jgi:heme-degrading monooxygenase HmoA
MRPSLPGGSPGPIACTPEPPYYAVIFTTVRPPVGAPATDGATHDAYERTAAQMERLAREQPGFLGVESARDAAGVGITVSYWSSLEAIAAWRAQADHREAQRAGRAGWYSAYSLRVCRVERASTFDL